VIGLGVDGLGKWQQPAQPAISENSRKWNIKSTPASGFQINVKMTKFHTAFL
jgi:hypothetical protein